MAAIEVSTDTRNIGPDARSGSGGMVAAWALLGLVFSITAFQAWGRWIFSDEFAPAPVHGPDVFPEWHLIALRVVEFSSVGLVVYTGLKYVVQPLRKYGRIALDGRLFLGCCITACFDCMLDLHQYIFAWDSRAINMGSWAAFLPFHTQESSSRYAEGLGWGLPMYIYTLFLVAVLGCWVVRKPRERFPGISDVRALMAFWVIYFVLDFVGEVAMIRITQAYAFAQTKEGLTLWSGTLYQFPLYEPFLCACFAVMFTGMRLSALDSPDGVSFIERGYERFRGRMQAMVRLLAVTGFCCLMLVGIYHIWFNWLSVTGDSLAPLPSYLRAG